MRSREFLMKDAYSFHLDEASLAAEYRNMYETYGRIFTRLGLRFRAMFADIELIGIPHRVVVSGRGLEAGTFEYRSRAAAESENLDRDSLRQRLGF